MDLIDTIIPLAEFKSDLTECILEFQDGREALLVTRNGHAAFVVQSFDKYREMLKLANEGRQIINIERALDDLEGRH